jgi:ABC-type sulfate transport system substrate-binding protein
MQQNGESLEIKQSHGGSGSQARAVVDGRKRTPTLAMWPDTDAIRKAGLISPAIALEQLDGVHQHDRVRRTQGQP